MKTLTRTFALVSAFLSMAAGAALLGWLFTREGTRGLVEWGYYRISLLVFVILSSLPLPLAAIGGFAFRDLESKMATGLRRAASLLAGFVIVASLMGFGEISIRSRSFRKPLPEVALVDPTRGIIPADATGILRLAVSSDPHWGEDSSNAAARSAILGGVAAALPRKDAFLLLGDNVELGMVEAPWREEATELAARLGTIPALSLLGNHDALVNGQFLYEKFMGRGRGKTDSGSLFYYSLDAGKATIVVLNLLWGAESFSSAQRSWLERTLEAAPRSKPTIVLSHCFFHSSGYVDDEKGTHWYDHYGTIAEISPILERHGVELVVSGHNHYMELLESGGVTYAVIGAMGGKLDPLPTHESPASLWFEQGVFGRLDLDIDERGISLRFVDDKGAIRKEAFVPTRP